MGKGLSTLMFFLGANFAYFGGNSSWKIKGRKPLKSMERIPKQVNKLGSDRWNEFSFDILK